MMKFLQHFAEIGSPRGRLAALLLAVVLMFWTAGAQALSPPPGTPINSQAAAQYRDINGTGDAEGNPLFATSNTITILLSGAARLNVLVTADSDPVAAGTAFTYTIRYENTGNAPAADAAVVSALPANVTFQSASTGGVYDPVHHTVTWSFGDPLAPGTGGFLSITVLTQAGLPPGTSIVNSVSITAADAVWDTKTLTTTIGSASNLTLEKSGAPATVAPDGIITYTLAWRNIGNLTAHNVTLSDTIPSGTSYVAGSATPAGSFNENLLSWPLGEVAAGAMGDMTFQVRVSSSAQNGSQITNQANIISTQQLILSNAVVTTVSSESLLLLKMDSVDPVRAGNNIIYTIELENTGSTPLTGILLTDPLPVGTTFVEADSAGALDPFNNRQVIWTIGNLAAGEKRTVTLTVQTDTSLTQGQLIENTATATLNELPPQAVRAITSINNRTAGQVDLFNAEGEPVIGYASGDTIYIQVTDLDRNTDPAAAETVSIVLACGATGDSETVTLTETGPDTGVFRGSIPTTLSSTAVTDGALSVAHDSRIVATYTDPLDDVPVHTAAALIDPLGVVFDSITGTPVTGAVVTLRNWDNLSGSCDLTSWPALPPGQVNPAAPTGADGRYAFPLLYPGDYCFDVAPPAGYFFPSAVADADLPPGYTTGEGSRGERFTLNAGDPDLILDIPVDSRAGSMLISKTVNKTTAAIGDMIMYTVILRNSGDAPVTDVAISDVLPHGFSYIAGSTTINASGAADPQATGGRSLRWTIATLSPGAPVTVTYRVVVAPDAKSGTGINAVSASGTSLGGAIVSNRASVKVKITEGVFTSKGTIIGRVFVDTDGSGQPKKDSGVPDVALYLEDGTRVITDKSGKFSIIGVTPGTRVLRLDETTLPRNLAVKRMPGRAMKSGASQFVEMTYGGLFKANFVCEEKSAPPAGGRTSRDRTAADHSAESAPKTDIATNTFYYAPDDDKDFNGPPDTRLAAVTEKRERTADAPVDERTAFGKTPAAEASSLEERVKAMTPDLDILSPQDGDLSHRTSIRVTVKFPLENSLSLTVNGNPVDANNIGTKMRYEKGKVALYEFVDVRLDAARENIIAAETRDPFNIVRGRKQITVNATGEAAVIVLTPDATTVEADGQSRITFRVTLRDARGNVVPYANTVTVDATLGDILEQDADPANSGHQIMCENGVALFTVVAPRETGAARITVQANNMQQSADVSFVPHRRPMLVTGIGEIVLGHGRSSGDISYLKDRSYFGDGTYLDGRGAFFMKGNIYRDFVLTAAFDSYKKRSDELFRESDTRLDSEDKYPIYGDESKTAYEAMSRENLYVKLEKDRSYLLYGDYRTDLRQTKLSAYNRSFNGLKFEVNTDKFKLRSFGAHTDQIQLIDTLPGKGISGFYYLTGNDIVEGSDRVAVETRHRLQPDSIVSRHLKARGSDYEIDYDLGTILFKEPIPSYDANGNPVYIVATYESRQAADKYYIYGGRAAYHVTDRLEIGATGIVEENAIRDNHILGADIKLNLPGLTTLRAEYAGTRGLFDIASNLTSRDGEGWSLDIESKPLPTLALKGYWRDLSDYFSNPSANDAVRGTRKYGLEAIYQVLPSLELKAHYLDQNDRINNSSRTLASLGATKKFTKTVISAEISHEEGENLTDTPAQISTTPAGLLNGVPFFNAYEVPERATFLKLALEREIYKDLSLSLSHKHDIGGNDYFVSQGGLNYKLNKQNRLYIREEYARYEEGKQNRTLLGVESQVIKNTTAFYEYRLADGADGSRNQQVMGLKNKWQVMNGLTANVAAEYLNTLSGRKNKNEPDAYAAAAGLEYLRHQDLKLTGRLEHRNEIDGDRSSYLAEVAAAYKLHPDYSLLLRERYFVEQNDAGDNHTSRLMIGLAYRPLDNDRFNALSKIEYKYSRQGAMLTDYTTDALIFSTEGVYQVRPDLQLMAKYAGKLEKDDSFSSYTDMIAGRFVYDLSDRFDVGAEYRLLTSHLTQTRLHGGSVEFGYRVIEDLWLSLGYSFDRFDEDLAGDSYRGEGPYLKLRFKFDENTLRRTRN